MYHFYSTTLMVWGTWCEGGEWKKRQIADISSIAMPFLLLIHSCLAHFTSLSAAFSLFGVEATIFTATWLEITSHTWEENKKKLHQQIHIVIRIVIRPKNLSSKYEGGGIGLLIVSSWITTNLYVCSPKRNKKLFDRGLSISTRLN